MDTIVTATSIPSFGGRVHCLHPYRSPLHVAAGQVSALNLAWALFQNGRLTAGDRVAVVGGQITGTTLAAGLIGLGCFVNIYERSHRLLSTTSAVHRYVHPTLAYWPSVAPIATTTLPFLDWHAGTLAQVTNAIEAQAQSVFRDSAQIHLNRAVHAVRIDHGNRIGLAVSSSTNERSEHTYDAVFFCDDFGEEIGLSEFESPSYWIADDLEVARDDPHVRMFVISGCNDAALTDALRVTHRDFAVGRLAEIVANMLHGSPIAKLIADGEAEARALQRPIGLAEGCYREAAIALDQVPIYRAVSHRLKASLVHGVNVYLAATEAAPPYGGTSSPIFKLLVTHALFNAALKFVPARVRIHNGLIEGIRGATFPLTSSRVIIRHGARATFEKLFSNQDLQTYYAANRVNNPITIVEPGWIEPLPVPRGQPLRDATDPIFIHSRFELAQKYAATEFQSNLGMRRDGYVLYVLGPRDSQLPSALFGIPVSVEPIPVAFSLSGSSNPKHEVGNKNSGTNETRPNQWEESLLHTSRIEGARRSIVRQSPPATLASTCVRVLDFIEEATPAERRWITFEVLCDVTKRSEPDDELFAAINFLAGPTMKVLEPRAIFVDSGGEPLEISPRELRGAWKLKTLVHPRTGEALQLYESSVIPFFTLGTALTGANR